MSIKIHPRNGDRCRSRQLSPLRLFEKRINGEVVVRAPTQRIGCSRSPARSSTFLCPALGALAFGLRKARAQLDCLFSAAFVVAYFRMQSPTTPVAVPHLAPAVP
jgi:hypothetical protein